MSLSDKTFLLSAVVFVGLLCGTAVAFDSKDSKDPELTYDTNGADWPGLCQDGKSQSPININTAGLVPIKTNRGMVEVESLGSVQGAKVFVTEKLSHVEVVWESFLEQPAIRVPARQRDGDVLAPLREDLPDKDLTFVEILPVQFHFHTPSENSHDGFLHSSVVHIVNVVKEGQSRKCDRKAKSGEGPCLVVLSVFVSEGTVYSPFDNLFRRLLRSNKNEFPHGQPHHAAFQRPVVETVGKQGQITTGFLDLNMLLPASSEYATWIGSLTTFPCTEDVMWVQFLQPIPMTFDQIKLLEKTVARAAGSDCRVVRQGKCYPARPAFNNRETKPLNGRVLRKGFAY